MKDVYIFIPEPGNNKAIVASSAIARAMKAMNKVAILRCVWRQGQGNVVVGVLTPNISCVDSIVSPFLFFCICSFSACRNRIANYFIFTLVIPYKESLDFLSSQIHFISMYFHLLRMFVSFSSHHLVVFLHHGNQMSNSKWQQITSLRC